MSKVAVVIPWRPHPTRLHAYSKLVMWYQQYFPEITIFSVDSLGEHFNRSQARNRGAAKAVAKGCSIIVFNDADVFVTPAQLEAGIKLVRETSEIVVPYSVVYEHTTAEQSEQFFSEVYTGKTRASLGTEFVKPYLDERGRPNRLHPCSGVVIAVPEVVFGIGGYDTRIKGWGLEDTAFHAHYFNKYGKLFTYLNGDAHSTYNDPASRVVNLENQKYVPELTLKNIS